MREEESNWFSKWEQELPSPQELTPLSQSLITPHLALAFNIINQPKTEEFDSPELSAAIPGSGGSEEPARTLKRPRLVWTPQLHKRFVDAVAHLGIKNAVPKTIMQLMSVDGLTRENVASHLQKYRLYLKRMQGGNSGNDSATDRLFASAPVPPHFLQQGRSNSEHFLPFVPVAMQQQMAVVGVAQQPRHVQQFRHFGNSQQNEQFDHRFVRPQLQRMGAPVPAFVEDLEPDNGRKALTLFPSGQD